MVHWFYSIADVCISVQIGLQLGFSAGRRSGETAAVLIIN